MTPLRGFVLLCAVSASARAITVEPIRVVRTPLSPPPVAAQLRADFVSLSLPTHLELPPSFVTANPVAWTNLRAVVLNTPVVGAAASATPVIPAGLAPTAPAAVPPAPGAPVVETDAVRRLTVAQEILGRYDPAEFQKLAQGDKDAAFAELWDGWRRQGLVADPEHGGEDARRVDRMILDGVDDKSLTYSNKSIFLGVGVLGYPLADAVWLARTPIGDALADNRLSYPAGQTWRNASHTPEILGTTPEAQRLVDRWGAATAYAAQVVRQVVAGSKELPDDAAVPHGAAVGFASLVAELLRAGDRAAVDTLSGADPTLTAFLLDAGKPGYYLYNGDGSAVARIMKTKAVAAMGIRAVDHPAGVGDHKSTYLYRPVRVVESLRAAARQPGLDGEARDAQTRLAAYAERMAPLAAPASEAASGGFTFTDPAVLPGSALESPANAFPHSPGVRNRYNLPFPLGSIRHRMVVNEPWTQFNDAQWRGLRVLLRSVPSLTAAPDDLVLTFVSESFASRGRLIAPATDGRRGAIVQMALLEKLAALEGEPEKLAAERRFLVAAFTAALSR